jgi:hypothetical protein
MMGERAIDDDDRLSCGGRLLMQRAVKALTAALAPT